MTIDLNYSTKAKNFKNTRDLGKAVYDFSKAKGYSNTSSNDN
ncbi:hypothetical protein SAMN04488023_12046 [Pedobacter rhizosphaerae]|uniref:Uncharacterized protein n=1 Tax=Pedobacter rhizosphaerae TaxID=390241 RepID=A0A1H9T1J1_9SPHI|nr:hypothetical protein SAMN04488023_12046 [Pedobacter rhizosphaerae]